MLIITRRSGESILIHTSDGTIEITVCESGHHTRLGIQAPESIYIQRAELKGKEAYLTMTNPQLNQQCLYFQPLWSIRLFYLFLIVRLKI